MRRVTVRWYTGAEQDLAHLWLVSHERSRIELAANEIDQLLMVGPASKGRPSALARLDEEACRIIAERATFLPEDLRWVRCGPLEAPLSPAKKTAWRSSYLFNCAVNRS